MTLTVALLPKATLKPEVATVEEEVVEPEVAVTLAKVILRTVAADEAVARKVLAS